MKILLIKLVLYRTKGAYLFTCCIEHTHKGSSSTSYYPFLLDWWMGMYSRCEVAKEMLLRFIPVLVLILLSIEWINCYRHIHHFSKRISLLLSNSNLDRELDLFFENAAKSGFADIKKLTIEERVERVNLGELLEDKIFAARDEILQLGKRYNRII